MANDTAFLDRMHCYIPGWEIPKYRPDFFTDEYAFITDYLSEFMKEMRKEQFTDACDKYFRFGSNLNQRDVIAVRKMISGFTKLLYPDGTFTKEHGGDNHSVTRDEKTCQGTAQKTWRHGIL